MATSSMPINASKRILMLHSIVFRCIPDILRKTLVSKTREKFGVIFSGSWLLKNVSGLPRYQYEIIRHKDISKWDTSLLCNLLLYSNLHLLTEQIPSSDYIILSPSELEITNKSTAWKVCATDKIIIVRKRFGSTKLVPVKYTILFTDMRALHLKLSNGLLVPIFQDTRIHLCTKQWSTVREMGNIRNQYAHRYKEKVSVDELLIATNKMKNALKWLGASPCQSVGECICFKSQCH